jgi:KDO2-lipid IV(A) lauroyltransferase
VGRPRPLRPLRQWFEAAALRGLGALARALPLETASDLGAGLGAVAHHLLARRRKIAIANVEAALGRAPGGVPAPEIVRRAFEQMGRSFLEFLALPSLTGTQLLERIELVGFEPAWEWARNGQGAVMLTAHFGNWELLGAAVGVKSGCVQYLLPAQTNRGSDEYLNEVRRRIGVQPFTIGFGMRAALRALRDGKWVGMLPDQDARGAGIHVPFFGRPASTHTGPARLAYRARCPILIALAERTGKARFRAPVRQILWPETDREEAAEVERLTAEIALAIEEGIRERPDHWYWIHRRWKTPPPAAAPSAGGARRAGAPAPTS